MQESTVYHIKTLDGYEFAFETDGDDDCICLSLRHEDCDDELPRSLGVCPRNQSDQTFGNEAELLSWIASNIDNIALLERTKNPTPSFDILGRLNRLANVEPPMEVADIHREAIAEFRFATEEHADKMRKQFDLENDPVTRKMWDMIEILEKESARFWTSKIHRRC